MRAIRWAAIAATVVALAEGAFIGRILFDETGPIVFPAAAAPSVAVSEAPPVTITANDQPTPVTPLSVQVEQQMPGLRVLPAVAADSALAAADARAVASKANAASLPAPEPARNGGFRVSAPIELHVCVDRCDEPGRQLDPVTAEDVEALERERDEIDPWPKIDDVVAPLAVGYNVLGLFNQRRARRFHRHARQHRA